MALRLMPDRCLYDPTAIAVGDIIIDGVPDRTDLLGQPKRRRSIFVADTGEMVGLYVCRQGKSWRYVGSDANATHPDIREGLLALREIDAES